LGKPTNSSYFRAVGVFKQFTKGSARAGLLSFHKLAAWLKYFMTSWAARCACHLSRKAAISRLMQTAATDGCQSKPPSPINTLPPPRTAQNDGYTTVAGTFT